MGWTTATGEIGGPGLALFAILFFWQMPHFIAIATFRVREYGEAGFRTLPAVRGTRAAIVHSIFHAALLLVSSVGLYALDIAGPFYLVVALIAGAAYLGWAIAGLTHPRPNRWARRLFVVSLLYLPVVFLALGVDVTLTG